MSCKNVKNLVLGMCLCLHPSLSLNENFFPGFPKVPIVFLLFDVVVCLILLSSLLYIMNKLCFRIRNSIRRHVGDVDVAAVPCGWGRASGNKV